MITRIEAYNYRCFSTLAVDVDRYQVLAGSNGSGKSTLLDIPILLGDLLRADRIADAFLRVTPQHATARASSFAELRHRGLEEDLVFSIEAELPQDIREVFLDASVARSRRPPPTHARYEVRLGVFNRGLEVNEEYLFLYPAEYPPERGVPLQGRSAGGRSRPASTWRRVLDRPDGRQTKLTAETTIRGPRLLFTIEPEQLALASIPADSSQFPAARWVIELLRQRAVFYDPNWDVLRRAAAPGNPIELLPDARNAPWLALELSRTEPDRFRFWIDHVRTALPQVTDIGVHERDDDHFAYFSVGYTGGYRVTSSGLSDGTLRILALSLLPYLPAEALPTLMVTEEPENGIHPQAIETVVQSLSSVQDCQVWLSTHSPIVLSKTDLGDVLAARIADDGAAEVVVGTKHPRLRDWRGSLDLGSLFASGVLS